MPFDDIWDHEAQRARLCKQECKTCIFKPDSSFRMGAGKLRDGRFRQLVKDATEKQSFIVCHMTLYNEGAKPAICRGFYERFSTNMLRVAFRLGAGWTEVNPDASS